jgi:hypothetical protein
MMVSEPDWLHVGALAVPFPGATEIVYRPVDEEGRPLGPGAAGRSIVAVRSDGYPVSVIDLTDGAYRVPLVHMGFPRPIVVTITEDGVELPVRPVIEMQ